MAVREVQSVNVAVRCDATTKGYPNTIWQRDMLNTSYMITLAQKCKVILQMDEHEEATAYTDH